MIIDDRSGAGGSPRAPWYWKTVPEHGAPPTLSASPNSRLFPQRLQGNLRLQRRIDLPSRPLRHLPLRLPRRNGLSSNWSTGPKIGVHFRSRRRRCDVRREAHRRPPITSVVADPQSMWMPVSQDARGLATGVGCARLDGDSPTTLWFCPTGAALLPRPALHFCPTGAALLPGSRAATRRSSLLIVLVAR